MSRTIYVPLKIFCGAEVSAGTPFLSFTEYLPALGSSVFSVETPAPLRDTTENEDGILLIINNLLLFWG